MNQENIELQIATTQAIELVNHLLNTVFQLERLLLRMLDILAAGVTPALQGGRRGAQLRECCFYGRMLHLWVPAGLWVLKGMGEGHGQAHSMVITTMR